MRLRIHNNTLYANSVPLETGLTVEARADKLVQMGSRPSIALSIAHGELSTRIGALALARWAGLVGRVETDEARRKGLVL